MQAAPGYLVERLAPADEGTADEITFRVPADERKGLPALRGIKKDLKRAKDSDQRRNECKRPDKAMGANEAPRFADRWPIYWFHTFVFT